MFDLPHPPQKWKIKKFPLFLQYSDLECGPACLYMVATSYGSRLTFHYLRNMFNFSSRGVSLQQMCNVSGFIGLSSLGVHTSFKKLCEKAQLPCIVLWRQRHFVVVYRIDNKTNNDMNKIFVYVADPSLGFVKYTEEEFIKNWITGNTDDHEKGVALLLEPAPYFYQSSLREGK